MMTAHATTRPIKTAADIASSNQDVKELFYFDMVGGRHLDRPPRFRGAQHHDRR